MVFVVSRGIIDHERFCVDTVQNCSRNYSLSLDGVIAGSIRISGEEITALLDGPDTSKEGGRPLEGV